MPKLKGGDNSSDSYCFSLPSPYKGAVRMRDHVQMVVLYYLMSKSSSLAASHYTCRHCAQTTQSKSHHPRGPPELPLGDTRSRLESGASPRGERHVLCELSPFVTRSFRLASMWALRGSHTSGKKMIERRCFSLHRMVD